MEVTLSLDLPDISSEDDDNITDWALTEFQTRYGPHITKDDIWEYLYGVMHAPDWRERYRHDLQRNLPRIPLADDFEAFRSAGRELMNLHINYETVNEWPVECQVEETLDEGAFDANTYRIGGKMSWGSEDRTVLIINNRCRLVDIPAEAENYKVSGRSPLQWAIDSLRVKHDKKSGIRDDVNEWHEWVDEPFNLIRHLRRLITVSIESSRIIETLPPALETLNTKNS